jgi:hypothetical protein
MSRVSCKYASHQNDSNVASRRERSRALVFLCCRRDRPDKHYGLHFANVRQRVTSHYISARAMSGLVYNKTAMSRLIARKARRPYQSARWLSSRPYKFHVGASWAGKPPEANSKPKRLQIPFPPESVIGTWRDKTLSRPKAVNSVDAGEDFFYVQEVSSISSNLGPEAHGRCAKMRNGSVREFCTRAHPISFLNSTLGRVTGCCRWCGWMG